MKLSTFARRAGICYKTAWIGQIGVRQAGKVIRRRIYDAIANAYPEYAAECQRQMQARYGALSEQQEEA